MRLGTERQQNVRETPEAIGIPEGSGMQDGVGSKLGQIGMGSRVSNFSEGNAL